MIFDKQKLKTILMEEEQISDHEADIIIERLEKVNHPQLQKCLDQWMENRTVSDEFNIDGVTIKMIMEKKKRLFCSALLTMDVFIDNPQMLQSILTVPSFKRRHPFGR
ncbi:hypothetical protein [Laceyella tengchongensis]|uniref:hypothetical protein n=1 Tax=Laceyella tengchongensis TaxID=574699 RepID=UPI0012B8C27E|nr:hypothetical protein [Laceyella tengchongensis]